jgi:hypothetical protein
MLAKLMKPVTTEAQDATVGSVLLYVAGVTVFVLSTLKLTSLQLTEAQLILGLLGVVCAALQLIVMGLLVEIRNRLRGRCTQETKLPV